MQILWIFFFLSPSVFPANSIKSSIVNAPAHNVHRRDVSELIHGKNRNQLASAPSFDHSAPYQFVGGRFQVNSYKPDDSITDTPSRTYLPVSLHPSSISPHPFMGHSQTTSDHPSFYYPQKLSTDTTLDSFHSHNRPPTNQAWVNKKNSIEVSNSINNQFNRNDQHLLNSNTNYHQFVTAGGSKVKSFNKVNNSPQLYSDLHSQNPTNTWTNLHVRQSSQGLQNNVPGISSSDEKRQPFYDFGYGVVAQETGAEFEHAEERRGGSTTGQYKVLLPDGRRQLVKYIADEEGFRPEVSYEGRPSNERKLFNNYPLSPHNLNTVVNDLLNTELKRTREQKSLTLSDFNTQYAPDNDQSFSRYNNHGFNGHSLSPAFINISDQNQNNLTHQSNASSLLKSNNYEEQIYPIADDRKQNSQPITTGHGKFVDYNHKVHGVNQIFSTTPSFAHQSNYHQTTNSPSNIHHSHFNNEKTSNNDQYSQSFSSKGDQRFNPNLSTEQNQESNHPHSFGILYSPSYARSRSES